MKRENTIDPSEFFARIEAEQEAALVKPGRYSIASASGRTWPKCVTPRANASRGRSME